LFFRDAVGTVFKRFVGVVVVVGDVDDARGDIGCDVFRRLLLRVI
jgi:hypothetical protein